MFIWGETMSYTLVTEPIRCLLTEREDESHLQVKVWSIIWGETSVLWLRRVSIFCYWSCVMQMLKASCV